MLNILADPKPVVIIVLFPEHVFSCLFFFFWTVLQNIVSYLMQKIKVKLFE